MKKIFIFIFALSLFAKAWGEEHYSPLLEEGKKWIIETQCIDDPEFEPFRTVISYQSEDIIDGERIVTLISLEQKEGATPYTHLLKEKDMKVYVWNQDFKTWRLYLDFSCKKGEETDYDKEFSTQGYKIIDEGYSNMHGYDRRWLKLNGEYWIEGIGAINLHHLFTYDLPACENPPFLKTYSILECYKDDNLLYNQDDYIRLSSVDENQYYPGSTNPIFDLHGREVSNPLPGSIYIRNGKKFIAK